MSSLIKIGTSILLSFLLIISVSLFGNISLAVYLKLAFIFAASLIVGAAIIKHFTFTSRFSAISFVLLSSFIGLSAFSVLTFADLQTGLMIFSAALMAAGFYLWKKKEKLNYSLSAYDLLAILVAFICSLPFAFGDTYAFASSASLPVLTVPSDDMYFFINLIHTLASGTIQSANYEIGTPVNYQFFGYLPAAFITKYSGVPAHLSLYCFEFGLLRLLPFVLISELVKQYDFHAAWRKWYIVLAPLFFTFLQPLHPFYLLKLDTGNFVWSGLGYIGPSLNIGYSFSFVIVLVCICLIKDLDHGKSLLSASLFLLLFVSLVGIKIPIFFAFGSFAFSLAVWHAYYRKDFFLLKTILIAVPLTLLLLYSLYLGGKTGGVFTLHYSYFPNYFNDLFHFSGSLMNLKIVLGIIVLLCIWGSLRFLFLLHGILKSKSASLQRLYFSSFFSLLACVLVASVFDMKIVEGGEIIRDISYDSLQFIRSAFFILNTIAVLAVLFFFDSLSGKAWWGFAAITAAWMLCSAIGLVSNVKITEQQNNKWLAETSQELKAHPTEGLLTVNPSLYQNPYSIWLTASNPGLFWTSNGGCLTTTKNYYRHQLYDSLLTQENKKSLEQMKKEGVAVFIATPGDIDAFKHLEQKGWLHQVEHTKWLFSFSKN